MKKVTYSLIIAGLLFGAFMLLRNNEQQQVGAPLQSNTITEVDGKQIIEITAKGGYTPRKTVAKANIPSVIRVKTNGTYDCSAALTFPSLKQRSFLPPTGVTDIELPAQASGSVFKGVCSMGMYNFEISFK